MSKLDQIPDPVREGISIALFVGAITSTAAILLHQPMFLVFGVILFVFAWFRRIGPNMRAYYEQEAEAQSQYDEDATYEPILDRYEETGNEAALFEAYGQWKTGPYRNETRLRFLQTAILALIDHGDIYRVEELMVDVEKLAAEEGLTERFETFRAECDREIAELAQRRLGQLPAEQQSLGQLPTEQQSLGQLPAEQQPLDQLPAEQQPLEQLPTEQPGSGQQPG